MSALQLLAATGATGTAAGAVYTRALSPNPEVIPWGGNCLAVVYDPHLWRQLLDNCSLASQVQHQCSIYAGAAAGAVYTRALSPNPEVISKREATVRQLLTTSTS